MPRPGPISLRSAAPRGVVRYSGRVAGGNRLVRPGGLGPGSGASAKTGIGLGGGSSTPFDVILATLYLANMADALEAATEAAKLFLEVSRITIDNFTFKLFYRATTAVLVVASVLASAKQIFGDPISCEVQLGSGVKDDVLDSYCWMYSSFNLPSSFRGSCAKKEQDPTALYNTYYQWVPIYLGLNALFFCLPRLFWLMMEGGLMKFLTKGTTGKLVEDPTEKRAILLDAFRNHLENRYNTYAYTFFLSEQFNALTLLASWILTDKFLQNQFFFYGPSVYRYYYLLPTEEREKLAKNPMCEVFPRVSSCDFVRYGLAGRQQNHNAICVLSLNMVNDKLFLLLWFWYAFLTLCVLKRLSYRFLQLLWPSFRFRVLHARIRRYLTTKSQARHLESFVMKRKIGDWFVLYQMSRNMNLRFYTEFLLELVAEKVPSHAVRFYEVESQVNGATLTTTLTPPTPPLTPTPTTKVPYADAEETDDLDNDGDSDFARKKNRRRKASAVSYHSEIVDLNFEGDSE